MGQNISCIYSNLLIFVYFTNTILFVHYRYFIRMLDFMCVHIWDNLVKLLCGTHQLEQHPPILSVSLDVYIEEFLGEVCRLRIRILGDQDFPVKTSALLSRKTYLSQVVFVGCLCHEQAPCRVRITSDVNLVEQLTMNLIGCFSSES